MLELLLKKQKKLPWPLQFSLAHVATLGAAQKFAPSFTEVETYCTFIGYSRSGHSLVAALLDAHPNIVMAHELRAIKYVRYGFGRDALYYLLFQMTKIRGHSWRRGGGYTYDVPNQWQGRFDTIRVIGDKHGQFTVCHLANDPKLLQKLREVVKVPVKFIHVVRNPFDNIATMALRKAKQDSLDVQGTIDHYFKVCESVMKVAKMVDSVDVYELRQEDFIRDPKGQLRNLCLWLGVETSSSYLEDCASIVFDSPHKSRHKIEWSEDLKQEVESKMRLFPFFDGYTFEH
ncbi:MAG: sulfotransferase [Cyanobacteriota bacterium]|nr:sulfotransferase [Cyanobacteriota bacterium]